MDPYRFSVKAQLTSRPRVIAEIKEACRRVGAAAATSDPAAAAVDWESTFVDAIVSAVSEAMNNIVLHACGGGTDDPVDFDIQAGPSSLVVRITDRGAPAQFVDPAPEPPPLAEGGMGMQRTDDRAVSSWGTAVFASLIGCLIPSMFLSLSYHFILWIHLGIASALYGATCRRLPDFRVRVGFADVALCTMISFAFIVAVYVMLTLKGY